MTIAPIRFGIAWAELGFFDVSAAGEVVDVELPPGVADACALTVPVPAAPVAEAVEPESEELTGGGVRVVVDMASARSFAKSGVPIPVTGSQPTAAGKPRVPHPGLLPVVISLKPEDPAA